MYVFGAAAGLILRSPAPRSYAGVVANRRTNRLPLYVDHRQELDRASTVPCFGVGRSCARLLLSDGSAWLGLRGGLALDPPHYFCFRPKTETAKSSGLGGSRDYHSSC